MTKTIFHFFSMFMAALLISVSMHAEVKLPAIFGNHMVLQQQTDAAIWGKASPSKNVSAKTSWDGKSYSTRADNNGNWKLKVKTPKAGGPYSITISDGKELKLNDVLIGEVWVCSGQSNMEMPVKGFRNQPVIGSNEAIANSANESIRLFSVTRKTSLEPLDDFTGQWTECIPENAANFSATAYYFGRMLQKALGVPVGLINSSWGGTRIEPWISENGIKKFDFVPLPDKNQTGTLSPQIPTVLYNAMIKPMVGFAMRGGIWYQGESNRNEYKEYQKLMPGLIQNWRDEWGIGDFPFYYMQIAPFVYGGGVNSAFLREAQLKASTVLENTGMACLMDVGEATCIHPANKQIGSERLAYLALAKTYGKKGFEYSGPVLKEMTVEGIMVKLTFDHAANGMTTFGKDLVNFKIAGENKRFYPAQATITGSGISLVSPMVEKPVAVRYAFDDFVVGELFNTEGFPVSSFRTDDWEQ
ncbi:MAG: sialate O-acetylesterase [Mangrovibacterium sp.]